MKQKLIYIVTVIVFAASVIFALTFLPSRSGEAGGKVHDPIPTWQQRPVR